MNTATPPVAPPQNGVATIAPIVATPFTQTAVDAALPKPGKPPPVEATTPEQEAAAASVIEPDAPLPPADTGKTKLQLAQEASAALVAKRAVARKTRQAETTETQRLATENARLQQERDAAQARAEAFDKDALGEMRKRGIPDKAIQQAAIDDASPEGRIARLERELQERDKRDNAREQRAEAEQQRANVARMERAFVSEAIESKVGEGDAIEPAYPLLAARAKVDPEIVVAEAHSIIARSIAQQRAKGVPPGRVRIPTNEDVYEYQEWLLQQAFEARLAGHAGAPPASEAVEAPAAPPPKKPNGTKTLSVKRAGPAAAPKSYDEMSEAERLAHMAAQLKALHTKP